MFLWYSIYMYDVILYGFGDCAKKEWLFSANRTILPSLQNIVGGIQNETQHLDETCAHRTVDVYGTFVCGI
jgi:hypothetical protein